MLEKTLESPLDCKEIQPVHSEGERKDKPETVGPWVEGGGPFSGEVEDGRMRARISRPSLAANELGGLGRHFPSMGILLKGRIWGSDLWVLFCFTDFLLLEC